MQRGLSDPTPIGRRRLLFWHELSKWLSHRRVRAGLARLTEDAIERDDCKWALKSTRQQRDMVRGARTDRTVGGLRLAPVVGCERVQLVDDILDGDVG